MKQLRKVTIWGAEGLNLQSMGANKSQVIWIQLLWDKGSVGRRRIITPQANVCHRPGSGRTERWYLLSYHTDKGDFVFGRSWQSLLKNGLTRGPKRALLFWIMQRLCILKELVFVQFFSHAKYGAFYFLERSHKFSVNQNTRVKIWKKSTLKTNLALCTKPNPSFLSSWAQNITSLSTPTK